MLHVLPGSVIVSWVTLSTDLALSRPRQPHLQIGSVKSTFYNYKKSYGPASSFLFPPGSGFTSAERPQVKEGVASPKSSGS